MSSFVESTSAPSDGAKRDAAASPGTGPSLLEALADAVLVLDPVSSIIRQANSAAAHLFGCPPDQLIGRELQAFAQPGAGADLCSPSPAAEPQRCEWRLRGADGRTRWADVTIGSGRLTIAVLRDITARKEREREDQRTTRELRAAEERLQLLLGRIPIVAIQACGLDGAVRYWNAASEQLYGYKAEEAVGRPLVELIGAPAQRETLRCALHQMLVTGRPFPPAEYQLIRRGGETVVVYTGHVVLASPAADPEVYRLDFDLSARRQAEGERLEFERQLFHYQKLESLGVLAGGIAHDFNNLLTGILGNLELARSESPDAVVRTWLDEAITAARRAGQLTAQMLAYAGRAPFHLRPADLNLLVDEQTQLLQAATAGRAALQFDLAPNLPAVAADPGQVGQVILTLVTNAAEAIDAPPGSVVVRTGLEPDCPAERLAASRLLEKPAPQTFVFLEVSDSGCGMDKATVQRVFDPFFSTKFAGRELGLPAVLGIVRAHHGAIFVDSHTRLGTTVRVLLPLAGPVSEAATCSPPPDATALLIVAGGLAERQLCAECGRELGLDPLPTPTGALAAALGRLRTEEIGAVVATQEAAENWEWLEELRGIRPGLPVLWLGAPSLDAARSDAHAAWLPAPFTKERLAEALRALIARPQ